MASDAAAIIRRRFESFRLMREKLERARKLKANTIEEKKKHCLPDVIKKLCPNPINPNEDCFAMTLDTQPPLPRLNASVMAERKLEGVMAKRKLEGLPHCAGMRPIVHIKSNIFSEALLFYKAAFGAEVVKSCKRRLHEADTNFNSEAVLKIGSQTYAICNSEWPQTSTSDGAHFSLLTDDVGSAVDKALKAGAALSGKSVQVYTKCRRWCKLVKVDDPYGNVWIIHSKLCPSCLQTFVLLV